MRSSTWKLLLVLIAVIALVASSCGSDGDDTTTETTTPTATTSAPTTEGPTTVAPTTEAPTTEAPTTEAPTTEGPTTVAPTTVAPTTVTPTTVTPTTAVPGVRSVNVFWLRDTQIAVGGREVTATTPARGAIEALLAGPNQLEGDLQMVSAVPAGTELLGLTIANGVAIVDFSSDFEATGLGTAGELGLVAQVVYTLTQFADSVDIHIEGEARDAILSHGLEATGLTRAGLDDAVAPAIVVESPYPGEVVTSPLTVTGFSRTFEASVVWDVVIPPSGLIVDSGFTTAAQPEVNEFGPFSFTAEFETDVAGLGAVIVFEESAVDGSQINVYEVPVQMQP